MLLAFPWFYFKVLCEGSYELFLSYIMSVAVVTWKSKIPLLNKFKIMKLKIDAFIAFHDFFKVLYQRIYE